MEARAIAKYVRMSPSKVGVILDLIRGKQVNEAFAILQYTPREAAVVINKVLKSAVANAENNLELNADNLYVSECFVGQGSTLKRFQPHAQGRAFKILKRTSNITVVVKERAQFRRREKEVGQKVNPHGLRVGVIKGWDAKWFANKKNFADNLVEDNKIRKFVKKELFSAGISKIEIERAAKRVKLNIYTAKPGVIIGKGGAGIEALKNKLTSFVSNKNVLINIVEVKNAEADAQLMAENIAAQLEKRISFRRAMKQTMQRAMKHGIKGVNTACSGRLGGAEIARTEQYHEGTIPLQTLRADIDYGFAEADTTYGKIGVKVWVYNGEVLPTKKVEKEEANAQERRNKSC